MILLASRGVNAEGFVTSAVAFVSQNQSQLY